MVGTVDAGSGGLFIRLRRYQNPLQPPIERKHARHAVSRVAVHVAPHGVQLTWSIKHFTRVFGKAPAILLDVLFRDVAYRHALAGTVYNLQPKLSLRLEDTVAMVPECAHPAIG
jgi:hypothetical protein